MPSSWVTVAVNGRPAAYTPARDDRGAGEQNGARQQQQQRLRCVAEVVAVDQSEQRAREQRKHDRQHGGDDQRRVQRADDLDVAALRVAGAAAGSTSPANVLESWWTISEMFVATE